MNLPSPSTIRACAIANAVYLEHPGGKGDVASWDERDHAHAVFVARQINAVLDAVRVEMEQRIAAERERCIEVVRLFEPVDSTDSRHQGAMEACRRITAALQSGHQPTPVVQ